MPRRKKSPDTPDLLDRQGTMTQTAEESSKDAISAESTVTVDYDGRIAKQKKQRAVSHTYSPRILNMYKDGVGELILEPGVNTIDRELYDLYVSEQIDAKTLVARGQVKPLPGLPDHQQVISGDFKAGTGGLICRTRTQSGLDWIESQAQAIDDKEQRDEVIEMIQNRRPYASAVALESVPFVNRAPGVAKFTAQPRA